MMATLPYVAPFSIAFGAGSALHLVLLKNVELDVYIPEFGVTSILSFLGLIYYYSSTASTSITAYLAQSLAVSLCFVTGIFSSMAIYRLFFHRIRNFPGPVWASLSRFYALHLSAKNVQYHVEPDKLHEQYGDFIRTGPREICVVRKSAIPLILGPKSTCSKTTFYDQVSRRASKNSLFFTRDPLDHRRRKRNWEKGLNVKSLTNYQSRIKSKVDLLIGKLAESAGTPQNATTWTSMLAFDIMGEVGFGNDFREVATGEHSPAAKAIHDHMLALGILYMAPWLLYLLQYIPGATAGYGPFFKWCTDTMNAKKANWNPEKPPRDIASWLIKAAMEKDAGPAPSDATLNEDSRLIIIAGSDTSASANACTLYFLAKHRDVLRKLQQTLDKAMPRGAEDWSYDKVSSVTYLDDVINESLRLKPPVITGGYRATPPEGLQIDEVFIPGDINVFTPIQLIHTDERYWEQPQEFVPERWGEKKEEMATDESAFLPFSMGAHRCPGDRLAMMGMRITISNIVQNFDIRFAPDENGEVFDTGRKDVFTTVLPSLQLCFTPRK